MRLIYVCGPFKGPNGWEIEKNVRRAEQLALAVWGLGVACICPHTNTRHFFHALGEGDHVFYEGDLEILRRCDALITTAGWGDSNGAKAEVNLALDLGIPVFHSLLDLANWVKPIGGGG